MRWIATTIFAGVLLLASAKASGAEEENEPVLRAGDSIYIVVRAKSYMPFVSEPTREIARVFERVGVSSGIPSSEFLRKYPDFRKGYPATPRMTSSANWRGTAKFVADVIIETLNGSTKRTVTLKGQVRGGLKPRIIVANVGPVSVSANNSQMVVSVESKEESKRIALNITLYQIDNDELLVRGIILEEGKGTLSEGKVILPGFRVEKRESKSLLMRKSFDDAMSKLEGALITLKSPTK